MTTPADAVSDRAPETHPTTLPFPLPIVAAPIGSLPDGDALLVSRLGTDALGRRRISAVKIKGLPAGGTSTPTEPASVDLAAALRDTTANLDSYIERRAQEIAAPRIAAIEQAAAERIAEVEGGRNADVERFAGLEHELRRRIKHLETRCDQLAWVARYLPAPIRSWAFGGTSDRHPFDRPRDSFADGVDRTAAELGLTPYAEAQP